jgi:hypothetical protein
MDSYDVHVHPIVLEFWFISSWNRIWPILSMWCSPWKFKTFLFGLSYIHTHSLQKGKIISFTFLNGYTDVRCMVGESMTKILRGIFINYIIKKLVWITIFKIQIWIKENRRNWKSVCPKAFFLWSSEIKYYFNSAKKFSFVF